MLQRWTCRPSLEYHHTLLGRERPDDMPSLSSVFDCKPIDPANQKYLEWDTNQKINRPRGVAAKINSLKCCVYVGRKNQQQEHAEHDSGLARHRWDKNGSRRDELENSTGVNKRNTHGHSRRKHLSHGCGFDEMAQTGEG